jgi:hypothetical protein
MITLPSTQVSGEPGAVQQACVRSFANSGSIARD